MSPNRNSILIAAFVSLIASSAIFTITALNAPQYEPSQFISKKPLGDGLVAWIRFSEDTYNATDWVSASYEYFNPTDKPINATLPKNYPIYSGYEDQTPTLTPYRLAHQRNVTIQPNETVSIFDFNCPAIAPGSYTASLNGTFSRVVIRPIALIPKVVTDMETYKAGKGGTATLEMYNPEITPLSYHNFGHIRLIARYEGDMYEDYQFDDVQVSWVSMYSTVQPGDSHKIWSFHFSTPKPGTMILDFNGVVKTIRVE